MGPVLLLDTYSLLFRAFHALPAMNTAGGEPTNALYGVSVLFMKLLRERKPSAMAFALDSPRPTFRHERFAAYKAHRPAAPDPLRFQITRMGALIEASGAAAFRAPGFEADDILATLAAELREAGTPALIVSGDRDILQLARDTTRVLFVGARGKQPQLYDAEAVRQRFGVEPADLPSRTALVGDTSDNLPSVPGIGEKTAQRLLGQYHNVHRLLEHLPEVTPAKARAALENHREQILETEQLARLCESVPLPAGAHHAPITVAALTRLRALFEQLEFSSLLPRIDALMATYSELSAGSNHS